MLSHKHNHLVKKDIHLAYPCKSTLDKKHFIYRFKQPLQLFYNLFTDRPKGKVSALGQAAAPDSTRRFFNSRVVGCH